MQLTTIPSNITTVEQLFTWCCCILDRANYPFYSVSEQNTIAPVTVFHRRISSGPNVGTNILMIAADLRLSEANLYTRPFWESVIEFDSNQSVPGDFISA